MSTQEHEKPLREKQAVYRFMDVPNKPLYYGHIQHIGEGGVAIAHSHGSERGVSASRIFTPEQVAMLAHDLIPGNHPSEEKPVQNLIEDLMRDPSSVEELYHRLGLEMMQRLMQPKSDRELGYREPAELIGSADDEGTNTWKIEDLLKIISQNKRASNYLNLAHISEEASFQKRERQAELEAKIYRTNRQLLDHLYQAYNVDFANSEVSERIKFDRFCRTTVYPTPLGFSFVETVSYDLNEEGEYGPIPPSQYMNVEIVTGKPELTLEEGYLPAT